MNSQTRQAGGALSPDDPTYVERLSDQALYEAIQSGELAYMLTSRQMGKSSLVARLAKRLRSEGWAVAVVDLSLIGSTATVTEELWYYGIAYRIAQDLGISNQLKPWWLEHSDLTRSQLFTEFLRELVLETGQERVAVFVDEIDSTLPLAFTDDFFAAVRAVYNARATTPVFSRLSITLLGVATPDQLIEDKRRTPFNIGQKIELNDFTLEQVQNGPGSQLKPEQNERVYYWTQGHPYLTQRLIRDLSAADSIEHIDQQVSEVFLNATHADADSNLQVVAARLGKSDEAFTSHRREVLHVYRLLVKGKAVVEQPRSAAHNELKLSGIVSVDAAGQLQIRNRIYNRAFNKAWIQSVLSGDSQLQRVRNQAIAVSASVALFAAAVWYLHFYPRQLIKEINLVTEDAQAAETIYASLKRIPWRLDDANREMAKFWDKKAADSVGIYAAAERPIQLLKALTYESTPYRNARITKAGSGVVTTLDSLNTTVWHKGAVWSVAFSDDGQRVVTGSVDNTAQVWDAVTGEPVSAPLEHQDSVWSVAFSGDGQRVMTGSVDNTARVWDAVTGEPVSAPLEHQGRVWSVAFSGDGQRVVTGSIDNTARVWDVVTGEPVSPRLEHQGSVLSVAFSDDGQRVVTGSVDNTARVWDAVTGEPVSAPLEHQDSVLSVAFSDDGQRVMTGSVDNTAQVWDAVTGEPVSAPLEHQGRVWSVAFSGDGQRVVTGSGDNTARVWDAVTGEPVSAPLEHQGAVRSVAFSDDGQRVVTGSIDNTARVWDAVTGEPVSAPLEHQGSVLSVAFSDDGQRVVTGSVDNTARVWDAVTGEPVSAPLEHQGDVLSVAFSGDGQRVMTGSDDNTARVWDAVTGEPVSAPLEHQGSVLSVAFSDDGQRVVTGSIDNTAQVWDAVTGEPVSAPLEHQDAVWSVAFSGDGQRVVTGSFDNTARVWDAVTGEPVSAPLEHQDAVWAVAFSGDGQRVVTGSIDNTARVWDAVTGEPVSAPLEHQGAVRSVAFSDDGQRVVTGSIDNTAQVWDAVTGEPVSAPLEHQGAVWSVAFSGDGQRVVTGSEDGAVREWRVSSGQLLGIAEFSESISDVQYSASGDGVNVASNWFIASLTRTGETPGSLNAIPEYFSPNQLSKLSDNQQFGRFNVMLFPVVGLDSLKSEDYEQLHDELLKKFVLEKDQQGNLIYPHEIRSEKTDAPDGVPRR